MKRKTKRITFSVPQGSENSVEEASLNLVREVNEGNLNMRTSGRPYPPVSLSTLLVKFLENAEVLEDEDGVKFVNCEFYI